MIIHHGGDLAFDALAYGVDRPPETTSFFQQEINNISNTLSDAGRGFFSNVRTLYDNINSSEAMRIARNALQTAASLFKPDTILPLISAVNFQTAGLVMQRYIMANPMVRAAFQSQRIDGYSDTYQDMYPGTIGDNHYDYRRVMDSVVQIDDKTDDWCVKYFPDDLVVGDKELSHDEKVDIISSWQIAEMFIRAGEDDPTSVYGGKM